jgi:hypothetical protein
MNKITEEQLEEISDEIEDAIISIMAKYKIGHINVSSNINYQGDCFDTDTRIKSCYESAYNYPCAPHGERGIEDENIRIN